MGPAVGIAIRIAFFLYYTFVITFFLWLVRFQDVGFLNTFSYEIQHLIGPNYDDEDDDVRNVEDKTESDRVIPVGRDQHETNEGQTVSDT